MAITTTCSGCGKTLAVAEQYAGRQARCPECGTIYTVPSPGGISQTPIEPVRPLGNLADTTGYAQDHAPLDLGTPTFPAPPAVSPVPPASNSASTEDKFWMRAGDGAEYGPADSATLARWFAEGRVGQNYQIRRGETGIWQPAHLYKPGQPTAPFSSSPPPSTGAAPLGGFGAATAGRTTSDNPYAAQSTYAPTTAMPKQYPKYDQSGLVLAMGILTWLVGCPIFGIIGWVVGAQAMADIKAERSDPSKLGVLQFGYYLCVVNVVLVVCCFGVLFTLMLAGAVMG